MKELTLIVANKKVLCKTFSSVYVEDYTEKKGMIGTYFEKSYDMPYIVDMTNEPFEDIQALHTMLSELTEANDMCVLRGESIGGAQKEVRRLENPVNPVVTLKDVAREWVMIDVDAHVELPSDIKENEISEYLIYTLFPANFHDVDYVFQFSNSAGIGHWSKGHFWFLCNPLTCKELQLWQKLNTFCDESAFKAAQPLYTADPVFAGIANPVKERVILKVKDKRSVTLEIPVPEVIEQIKSAHNYHNSCGTDLSDEIGVQGVAKWRRFFNDVTADVAHPHHLKAVGSYHSMFGCNADWNYFKQYQLHIYQLAGHSRANAGEVSREVEESLRTVRANDSLNLELISDYVYYKEILNDIFTDENANDDDERTN